jgi:hypothetical protein
MLLQNSPMVAKGVKVSRANIAGIYINIDSSFSSINKSFSSINKFANLRADRTRKLKIADNEERNYGSKNCL